MSWVTNVILTSKHFSARETEEILKLNLNSRESAFGQNFLEIPSDIPGGSKCWEADTFMAAVNYMIPINELLQKLQEIITPRLGPVLVIHNEDQEFGPSFVYLLTSNGWYKVELFID